MLETIFGGITAIATMYTAWATYMRTITKPTVKGIAYTQYEGEDEAQIRIAISSQSPVYIKSLRFPGRKAALECDGEKLRVLPYGIRFGTHGELAVRLCISPAPKNGEPIVIKLDTGNLLYKPTYELWPNDFTASGNPDQGKWFIHRSTPSASKAS